MLQLVRKIAFPISLVYALVVHVRNFLFDVGAFASRSYGTPTICVGNLSVGGTGKTPMTEYLLRSLKGHRVAVLSRGYKRRSKGFYLGGPESTVLDLGDEPYQIHRKFPKVTVAVDADRGRGIENLVGTANPELIVLDDAFQHRKVRPTYSILLTTFDNLYVDDWYLPTGNLRDAKKEAKRADLIIVTKCPTTIGEEDKKRVVEKLRPRSSQKVLFATLKYQDHVTDGKKGIVPLSELKNTPLALVTGIASPGPLLQFLRSVGVNFEHFSFGDHHHFTDGEVERFKEYGTVLTTEKDFVRLQGRLENLYYLEMAHSFSDGDAAVLEGAVRDLL